jgi:hypothetical protein
MATLSSSDSLVILCQLETLRKKHSSLEFRMQVAILSGCGACKDQLASVWSFVSLFRTTTIPLINMPFRHPPTSMTQSNSCYLGERQNGNDRTQSGDKIRSSKAPSVLQSLSATSYWWFWAVYSAQHHITVPLLAVNEKKLWTRICFMPSEWVCPKTLGNTQRDVKEAILSWFNANLIVPMPI